MNDDEDPVRCDLVLDGGTVVTVDRERRILLDGAVAIAAGRIVATGASAEIARRFVPDRTIDCRGKVVTPGLVNGHVHMSQYLYRGYVPDSVPLSAMLQWTFPHYLSLSEEEEALAVTLGCADLLRKGVTLVAEAGTMRFPMACAKAIDATGMRGVVGGWAWDLPPEPRELGMSCDAALEAIEELLDAVGTDPRQKVRACASVIGMATCSDELLVGTKALADAHGAVMNMHQSFDAVEVAVYREIAGFTGDPVDHLAQLGVLGPNLRLVHMLQVQRDCLPVLAEHATRIVHCDFAVLKEAQDVSQSLMPEMAEAGISLSIGTDTVNVCNSSDVLRLAHLVATLFKGLRQDVDVMPAETVFEMCTLEGARSVGASDVLGSIEPGKEADLVIFDARRPEWVPCFDVVSNLVYSADGGSVETVLVGGRVVVDQGRLTEVDEEALYDEVTQRAPHIAARAGHDRRSRWPVVGAAWANT